MLSSIERMRESAMTSENCLQLAIQEAEERLAEVPEDVKDAATSYSGSLYDSDKVD